ncbi:hypothetical protein SAMN06272769_10573 [Alcanivorax sp. DSM 26295]|nr:hypothetical protein SAMN06272769_10573 [Alcanivorax sp. DSM 26295]
MSAWGLFSSFLVFLLGAAISLSIRRRFNLSLSRCFTLYIWHSAFCLVYARYVISYGGDAANYYQFSLNGMPSFGLGTDAVVFFTYFLSTGFSLSFLGVSLVFNLFGFLGLLAFDGSLREATVDKSKSIRILATVLVFLPSVSYWSSGIGKDSLSFCAAGLALWAALDLRRRWLIVAFSILIMLLVRPHMAGILALALAGSFIFKTGVSLFQRFSLGILAFSAALLLVPLGLNYAGVEDGAGPAEIIEFVEKRQNYNQDGGGAVQISQMSLPVKMFTYLFRPTILEIRNLFSLAASVDNLILLLLVFAGSFALVKRSSHFVRSTHNRHFLWIYVFLSWILLSMTTANLGIALRQKWMFVPMLIFLLISVVGRPGKRITPSSRKLGQPNV